MTNDASDLLLPHARRSSVGFVYTDPPAPSALGSGVLISVGSLSGILTCAHVAEQYRSRSEIGLLRFSRNEALQMQKLSLGDTSTLYIEENVGQPRWSNPRAIDLAFTLLPPSVADALKAMCVFLNWELNAKKFYDGEPESDRHVDAVFGLIGQRTGMPTREDKLVTTPMRAELTPGHIVSRDNGALTLECMEYNKADLPESFGGTSGGGLWRTYIRTSADGSYQEVQTRLCGLASFQQDPTHIVCQGFERIELALVPAIRKQFDQTS